MGTEWHGKPHEADLGRETNKILNSRFEKSSPPVIAPPPPPESAAIIPAAPVAAIELVPEPSPESGNAAPAAAEDSAPARRTGKRAARKPEPVIPLIHAPDDPGPEAVEES